MHVASYFHKARFRRMDSGNGKIGMNVDGDRLSNLPSDLIHKILALVDTKHAVRTSTLSSRWRYIWTSMRDLNFSYSQFYMPDKFFKFVKGVLSGRNNQIKVSSVTLTVHNTDDNKALVARILNIVLKYAVSHNVQQITVACSFREIVMTPSAWDLLALTTLNLKEVVMYDDDKSDGLFSNFVNLKNLTLSYCKVKKPGKFNICHPTLSNLTFEGGCNRVTVVTPRLKNLIIKEWEGIHVRSAPILASLRCENSYYPLQLPTDLFHLEKVDICAFRPFEVFTFSAHLLYDDKSNARKIVSLLRQLRWVRFLTLNMEIIEILCSSVELISHQPSPFANLKSLKIHPKKQTQPEVTVCTQVKSYFFDGSPGATFT